MVCGRRPPRLTRQPKPPWEVVMSNEVIFKELPATFPENDQYKKPSILGSVAFHAVLIAVLLLIPFAIRPELDTSELLALLVTAPPPPPAPLPPPEFKSDDTTRPRIAMTPVTVSVPDAVIMPTVIPKELVRVIDPPAEMASGVIGGVPGGVTGGMPGGVLGSFLTKNALENVVVPPPPLPPPPPPEDPVILRVGPVRAGVAVREPRVISLVPPVYPRLASRARVSGRVVLEAILTAEGTVDEIRVISGHPLLVQAAIDCVKQWRYEPTYLNGIPVPVVLTATVNFHFQPES
jgi:protein TonB